MFMGTLQGPYLEKLIGTVSYDFSNLVITGERVENFLMNGKIQSASGSFSGPKKTFSNFQKKKEGETNVVTTGQPLQVPYPTQLAQREQKKMFDRKINPIPMSYRQISPYLVKDGLVELKPLRPLVAPLPQNYDPNARCDYHVGSPGHTFENCWGLKHKVQDLVESKAISLTPNGPNVKNNPMPNHAGPSVNSISEELGTIKRVEEIQMPLLILERYLMGHGLIFECHANCEDFPRDPKGCKKLRDIIQQLMN